MNFMKPSITLLLFGLWVSLGFAQGKPRPEAWAKPIHLEANLYQITPMLYRSEQLLSKDLPLIQELGLKTIISFRAFHSDEKHLQDQAVKLIRIPILTWNISDKQIAEALWQIKQAQKEGPVLIHCMHGADRTGLVAAMYRIIDENWTIEAAKRELMAGGYGYHTMWKNIEGFFTQKHVENISQLLKEKSHTPAN